jgi:hypothetical protein
MMPTTGTYEYCHFVSGHDSIHIHNADASTKQYANISSTVRSWAETHTPLSPGQPSNLKWTNDPDYIVYRWGDWSINPIIFRLSDRKWVGIRDDLTSTVVGDIDGVFFSKTDVMNPAGETRRISSAAGSVSVYTLTGRRLTPGIHDRNRGTSGIRPVVTVETSAHRTGGTRKLVLY